MKLLQRSVVLSACIAGLSACQPTLDPVVPANEAAYEAVAVPEAEASRAYALYPGDEVSVTVYGEEDLSLEKTMVDAGGNLNLPLIGELSAAGKTIPELNQAVESAYRARYIKDPRVTISLTKATGGFVTVEGEVKDPDVYAIKPGYTLLSAMALAGSPLPTGKVDHVLIFRQIEGQRMGGRFDLKAIRSGRADDPLLRQGDVIVVGYSRKQGLYQDFLKAAPLFNVFVQLADGGNTN